MQPLESPVVERGALSLPPPGEVMAEKVRRPVAAGAPESTFPLRYQEGQHRDFSMPTTECVLTRRPCPLGTHTRGARGNYVQ